MPYTPIHYVQSVNAVHDMVYTSCLAITPTLGNMPNVVAMTMSIEKVGTVPLGAPPKHLRHPHGVDA